MKYLFFILLFSTLSCHPNGFVIMGKLTDNISTKLTLLTYHHSSPNPIKLDSVDVKDGMFLFKGSINKMQIVALADEKLGKYSEPFFIENGKNKIYQLAPDSTCNFCFYTENIRSNYDKKRLDLITENYEIKHRDFYNKYYELSGIEDSVILSSNEYYESLNAAERKIDSTKKLLLAEQMNYIKSCPTSYYNAFFLFFRFGFQGNLDQKFQLYNTFDSKVKNSHYGKLLSNTLFLEGKVAPELIGVTIANQDFRLSNLRGKYVLLDFWASWCDPCRASHIDMKTLYENYKEYNNFEIVSIAFDDNKQNWLKAVEKDKIGDWYNLNKNDIISGLENYYISLYPISYLISPDGIVIKQFHGEHDFNKVKSILNNKKK
ncbi:MAG: AhpC/TSA family protein [Saprospiraceae bacterium]|nr:AhpC/TSA family protein [Saprospiraceae bacterium]